MPADQRHAALFDENLHVRADRKPMSSSQRPDMRRYGTTASGILCRGMRRDDSVSLCGALAGRGSLRTAATRSIGFRPRRRRVRLRAER
jgi:hypothetical protein